MFKIQEGDLFASNADALAHGVNARGIMGAGIAVRFKAMSEDMFESYAELCDTFGNTLGGLVYPYLLDNGTYIYNMFTQYVPGGSASYTLVEQAALAMRLHAEDIQIGSVGLPAIGCGIGDLELHNVAHLLDHVLDGSETSFVMYLPEINDTNREVAERYAKTEGMK